MMSQLGTFGERFEIGTHIGSGSMGAVYRAYDRDLGEHVALKLMLGMGGQELERFRREVRLARRVSHPNAARIHDLGHEGDRWFLTMELVDGETLAALMTREGRMGVARACRIAADICAGLAAIHDAGIVHRDVKPGNVLVATMEESDGLRVVVTDFGIAKAIELTEEFFTVGVIGTPGYMAPEQAMGDGRLDGRCDLYAVGVILFQMLSGQRPAEQMDPTAKLGSQVWPPPLDPTVPPALAALIHDCLARRPHQRPPNARVVEAALRAFADGATSYAWTRATGRAEATVRDLGSVPTTTGKRLLSVLPLRQRGGEGTELAMTISEELIDRLSRSRELWVISFAATERYRDEREPQRIGRELGADFVVDGTVQCQGTTLRVSVRLIDARSGLQLWSERLTGELDDVFELQDRLARTIAEHLRVELLIRPAGHEPNPQALALYLCGREHLRQGPAMLYDAYAKLDEALSIDPDFAAAAALRASAALRSWFYSSWDGEVDWELLARTAIADASRVAPDLSATHECEGIFALHAGDYATAVSAFLRALTIAPTNPVPLQYLGLLDMEIGQVERGRSRLRRAHSLAPTSESAANLARIAALVGDDEGHRRWIAVLGETPGGELARMTIRMRVDAWRRDRVALAVSCQEAASYNRHSLHNGQRLALPQMFAGEGDLDALLVEGRNFIQGLSNRRKRCMLLQCMIEAACFHDKTATALSLLEDALASHLLDIVWLDRCPLLAELRSHAAFPGLRGRLVDHVMRVPSCTTQDGLGTS